MWHEAVCFSLRQHGPAAIKEPLITVFSADANRSSSVKILAHMKNQAAQFLKEPSRGGNGAPRGLPKTGHCGPEAEGPAPVPSLSSISASTSSPLPIRDCVLQAHHGLHCWWLMLATHPVRF